MANPIKALTPEEIKKLPKVLHRGRMQLGDWEVDCAVLSDETRVITTASVVDMFDIPTKSEGAFSKISGMLKSLFEKSGSPTASAVPSIPTKASGTGKGGAGKAAKTQGYSVPHFSVAEPVSYRIENNTIAKGIEAQAFVSICEAFLEARKRQLFTRVEHYRYADSAERLMRGFARVGIIALIDEATGYQTKRDRQALASILDEFLKKEHAAWAKRFPDEFYVQIFRLWGWTWRGMHVNRPQFVGKITKEIVYKRLAPGILDELEKLNPADAKGARKVRHQQFLTDEIGHPALRLHIEKLMLLMTISNNRSQFIENVMKAFPLKDDQTLLALDSID